LPPILAAYPTQRGSRYVTHKSAPLYYIPLGSNFLGTLLSNTCNLHTSITTGRVTRPHKTSGSNMGV